MLLRTTVGDSRRTKRRHERAKDAGRMPVGRFQIRDEASGRTLARARTGFAIIKLSTGRACRMPQEFADGYPIMWPCD